MNEKPIIFQGWGVRAILDDRKTQTRRLIKPQPQGSVVAEIETNDGVAFYNPVGKRLYAKCPYGKPGDRLWVRETWAKAGPESIQPYVYREEWLGDPQDCYVYDIYEEVKWKPSIHMPRAASRLILEITDIRVERVQDISPHEILCEGVGVKGWDSDDVLFAKWIEAWDSIHGPGAWERKDWVWAITFRRLDNE